MEELNFDKVCEYVLNGGSLITYCEGEAVRYSDAINWIYGDEVKHKKYEEMLVGRGEWVAQRVLLELQKVGFTDVRKLCNDDGSLKKVSELDDTTAAAIGGIEIEESKEDKDGNEVSGRVRKIKMVDKLKGLEMLGKNLKMFTDKIDVSGRVTLEDLVVGSMAPEKAEKAVDKKESEVVETDDDI